LSVPSVVPVFPFFERFAAMRSRVPEAHGERRIRRERMRGSVARHRPPERKRRARKRATSCHHRPRPPDARVNIAFTTITTMLAADISIRAMPAAIATIRRDCNSAIFDA
jgi:hypothetical protein